LDFLSGKRGSERESSGNDKIPGEGGITADKNHVKSRHLFEKEG